MPTIALQPSGSGVRRSSAAWRYDLPAGVDAAYITHCVSATGERTRDYEIERGVADPGIVSDWQLSAVVVRVTEETQTLQVQIDALERAVGHLNAAGQALCMALPKGAWVDDAAVYAVSSLAAAVNRTLADRNAEMQRAEGAPTSAILEAAQ